MKADESYMYLLMRQGMWTRVSEESDGVLISLRPAQSFGKFIGVFIGGLVALGYSRGGPVGWAIALFICWSVWKATATQWRYERVHFPLLICSSITESNGVTRSHHLLDMDLVDEIVVRRNVRERLDDAELLQIWAISSDDVRKVFLYQEAVKQSHHPHWTLRLSLLDEVFRTSSGWTSKTISVHQCSLAV